jgi:hypothetical protein
LLTAAGGDVGRHQHEVVTVVMHGMLHGEGVDVAVTACDVVECLFPLVVGDGQSDVFHDGI